MDILAITRNEFQELRRLQLKHRWDWPAVFSANCRGEVWPFTRFGYTPGAERDEVRGLSSVVDSVADTYLEERASGGRFFINDKGAFYKDEASQEIQFLGFRFCA